jgi:hypothetical protein
LRARATKRLLLLPAQQLLYAIPVRVEGAKSEDREGDRGPYDREHEEQKKLLLAADRQRQSAAQCDIPAF